MIIHMKNFNYNDLDGRLLKAFLTILEETSVSRAAERLDMTQSAMSHILARLRIILGDPLFVRSGQGLVPTANAKAMREPVQDVLDRLMGLTERRQFDPLSENLFFRIAANDLQRELIFPRLFQEARNEGISIRLEFMPSGVPSVELLRNAQVEIVLTPLPPDASDIFLKKLLLGKMVCFYDASQRDAPRSLEEYIEAEHIAVKFVGTGTSFDVISKNLDKEKRKTAVSVSNFNAIPKFVKGSRIIATEVDLMKLGPLQDLDTAPLPFHTDAVSISMVWHERSSKDPAHIWLRSRVEKIASEIRNNNHVKL